MNNIIYNIRFEVYGCSYTFRVNDTKIFEDRPGRGVSSKLPVSHLLADGKNRFKFSIFPKKGEGFLNENSVLKISLVKSSGDYTEEILFNEQTPAFSPEKKLQTYTVEKEIEFKEPFPASVLYNAIQIRNSFDLRNNLIKEYKKIWALFNQKDIKLLMDEFSIKNKEYCLIYGLDLSTHLQSGYDSLSQVFESGWALWDIDYASLVLEVSFFDKMVTFYNKWGKSPLLFYNEDINLTTYFDLFFCRFASNAELQIIR